MKTYKSPSAVADRDHLAYRVWLLRVTCDRSRSGIAEALGIAPKHLQRWEIGAADIPAIFLIRYCELLDFPLADLCADIGNKYWQPENCNGKG